MSAFRRFPAAAALVLGLGALVFFCWSTLRRVERVEHVSATDAAEAAIDAASPTGYAGGKRWLIVPEHFTRSYERIAETQQMLATGAWRVRHVEYENAPHGRPVTSGSLYRWWLGALAAGDHAVSDRPTGIAVERAAVWSEPLLHLAFLVSSVAFVARFFGGWPAALFAASAVLLYPFAGTFLPGVPDDRSLARLGAFWSVLPLLAAFTAAPGDAIDARNRRSRRLFALAGVAGGIGLWVDAPRQTWILVGIGVGAAIAALLARSSRRTNPATPVQSLPWRAWSVAGAVTCVIAYLIEYAPSHLGARLEVNHPLYALAWLGLGELLAWAEALGHERSARSRRWTTGLWILAALAAVASLPAALLWLQPHEWLSGDRLATRLTSLPNGIVAADFGDWIARDGLSGAVVATIAPLAWLVPALALLGRGHAGLARRRQLSIAVGVLAVALPFAWQQLAWWSTLDALLLALLAALVTTSRVQDPPPPARAAWFGPALVTLALAPGLVQLFPAPARGEQFAFTRLEAEALLERAAAHWLADHAEPGGAVILVPPDRTTRWCFHGGLRGLGSASWENRDGLAATVQIVTAQTGEEAQARLQERGVTHLALPTWDHDLEQFAKWTLNDANDAFITAVRNWSLPSWLRPLPYQIPAVPGFENEAIVILQVTDENNRAIALARMLEFFLETERADYADAAGEALRRFPADINALVALAQLEKARGQGAAFAQTLATLLASVTGGADRGLPWDRRVSLAIALAQGERHDLAREQIKRCLERVDAARIRSLTSGALFRLQVLAQAYDFPIADPALRAEARRLVPREWRERLPP